MRSVDKAMPFCGGAVWRRVRERSSSGLSGTDQAGRPLEIKGERAAAINDYHQGAQLRDPADHRGPASAGSN